TELYELELEDGIPRPSRLNVIAEGQTPELFGGIGISSPPERTKAAADGLGIDLSKFVPHLYEYAFRHRGTKQDGVPPSARSLSRRRAPFDLDAYGNARAKSDEVPQGLAWGLITSRK
ncbi:hypothetical protein ACHAWF_004296, partial [Thalassiosira exigua]